MNNMLLEIWENAMGDKWENLKGSSWMAREVAVDFEREIWSSYRDTRRHIYSWATPCPEALEKLSELSPLVEIGAGAGYWAYLLRQMGVDILAYDIHPPKEDSTTENHWHKGVLKPWTKVMKGGVGEAAKYPDRTLFLCWPPFDREMAYLALSKYDKTGGKKLVYIGEDEGGCTASDKFFDYIEDNDWESKESIAIPQWAGLHDYMEIYEKT